MTINRNEDKRTRCWILCTELRLLREELAALRRENETLRAEKEKREKQ